MAQTGAVTLIQRFGGALNLNIHFHQMYLDGVYSFEEGKAVFHKTPPPTKKELEKLLRTHNVIFDVDVEGGIKLKNLFKESALSIFVKPPSIDELGIRLKSRAKDSDHSIKLRLEKAKLELKKENNFDIILVNDDLNMAIERSYQIVNQFLNI